MINFNESSGKPDPRSEQESILIFDVERQIWNFYTNYPKHARRWEERVVPELGKKNRKVYHKDNNELIEIEGEIEGFISIRAPRKLTEKQRKEIGERFKKTN